MRAIVLAGLVLSGCNWGLAQTTAFCTRSGTCDGGVDAGEIDAGMPDAGQGAVVLTNTGTAFGVTFDGENVWSVVQTSAGTAVFRDTRSVYTSASPPRAMYGNEETGRGVLVGLTTQLVMVAADGGASGMTAVTPPVRLVSLFNAGGNAFASVWSDGNNNTNYGQQVFDSPSLGNAQNLITSICGRLVFHDVEVLPGDAGGGAALTYEANACPDMDVSVGVSNAAPGVQFITPAGLRSGFVPGGHVGRTMVGRTMNGFDLASVPSSLSVLVTHHDPTGGSLGIDDTITASLALELGDTMFGYVLVVAQGVVTRNRIQVGNFAARTVLLVPLNSGEPVIELGPAAMSGRLGLWAGPTLIAALWDDASGNVMLTRFTR